MCLEIPRVMIPKTLPPPWLHSSCRRRDSQRYFLCFLSYLDERIEQTTKHTYVQYTLIHPFHIHILRCALGNGKQIHRSAPWQYRHELAPVSGEDVSQFRRLSAAKGYTLCRLHTHLKPRGSRANHGGMFLPGPR